MRAVSSFVISAKLVVLCVLGSLFLGCGEVKVEEEDFIPESSARLPGMSRTVGQCREYWSGSPELSLKDWIQTGDGLVFGTIEKVEPALDIGYTDMQGYEKRVRDSEECNGIEYSFKIHLKNVKGYFHDQDVSESLTVHIGYGYHERWTTQPKVTANEVIWPEGELKIEPGMRIGGLLFQEQLTGRWGFGLKEEEPIFQVIQDKTYVQKGGDVGNPCGPGVPVSFVESLSESALLEEIAILDVDSGLYVKREDRNLSQKEVSVNRMYRAGNWLGSCLVTPINEPGDQCTDNAGCDDGLVCIYGFCFSDE